MTKPRIFAALAVLLSALATTTASGQEPYPMVMGISPLAVQAGASSEHEVTARYNLYGTYDVLITGEGVSGEAIDPQGKPDPKKPDAKPQVLKLKVKFTAAADAQPGVRDVRFATPQGASTLGQLVVVADPVAVEKSDNNTAEKAGEVSLPAALCGTIEKNEDVDYFRFHVEAGAAHTFHCRSARLQDRIHDLQTHLDPIITLKNSAGTVLAVSDNFFYADPLLHYRFEKAGDYYLEVRDVRYQGNAYWHYCVEATERPFVAQVQPMSMQPGTTTTLRLVGFGLPADASGTISPPADLADGLHWLSPELGGKQLNPAPVVISRLPQAVELASENNEAAQGQEVAAPVAISGAIEQPGDIDCYLFTAKKGDRFDISITARRHQSALDSNLRILDEQGKRLTENDDVSWGRTLYADSAVEAWTAPADGRYAVEVRDLHLRGGDDFNYVIEIVPSTPRFLLEVDTDKTLLHPGMGATIYVRAYRKNGFDGEIELAIEGLPKGVSAHCGRILAAASDGCIVLEAAANAEQAVGDVVISGAATLPAKEGEEPQTLQAVATPLQETYMPGGGRGHYPVEMHTVCIGQPANVLSMKVTPEEVTLLPGQSQTLDVTIERAEGFEANVTLDVIWRHLSRVYGDSLPKGVTIDEKKSKTLIAGKDKVSGQIVLVAAADAQPVERQLVPVMANVSINFVMKLAYTAPVWVSVQPADAK